MRRHVADALELHPKRGNSNSLAKRCSTTPPTTAGGNGLGRRSGELLRASVVSPLSLREWHDVDPCPQRPKEPDDGPWTTAVTAGEHPVSASITFQGLVRLQVGIASLVGEPVEDPGIHPCCFPWFASQH